LTIHINLANIDAWRMNLCKMSVGSSNGIDAIRCRVFEIVAENEDIDALLKEV